MLIVADLDLLGIDASMPRTHVSVDLQLTLAHFLVRLVLRWRSMNIGMLLVAELSLVGESEGQDSLPWIRTATAWLDRAAMVCNAPLFAIQL